MKIETINIKGKKLVEVHQKGLLIYSRALCDEMTTTDILKELERLFGTDPEFNSWDIKIYHV